MKEAEQYGFQYICPRPDNEGGWHSTTLRMYNYTRCVNCGRKLDGDYHLNRWRAMLAPLTIEEEPL